MTDSLRPRGLAPFLLLASSLALLACGGGSDETGAGGAPHVKMFDGRTGAETHGFFAFAPSFSGGVRVAAGDVNGDGHAEIIVGAGPGGADEVRVFDPVTGTRLST